MMFKTHVMSSFSVALAPFCIDKTLIDEIGIIAFQFYLLGIFLGSIFPDIDEPNSKVSKTVHKYIPFLPHIIKLFYGHRGATHRFSFFLFFLLFAVLINIFTQTLELHQEFTLFAFAFAFGILLHHVGDMLAGGGKNKGGIKAYFYPLINDKDRYFTAIPYAFRCKVAGFKEYLYLLSFTSLVFYEIFLISKNLVH